MQQSLLTAQNLGANVTS